MPFDRSQVRNIRKSLEAVGFLFLFLFILLMWVRLEEVYFYGRTSTRSN